MTRIRLKRIVLRRETAPEGVDLRTPSGRVLPY
jgi:hypothetical protein